MYFWKRFNLDRYTVYNKTHSLNYISITVCTINSIHFHNTALWINSKILIDHVMSLIKFSKLLFVLEYLFDKIHPCFQWNWRKLRVRMLIWKERGLLISNWFKLVLRKLCEAFIYSKFWVYTKVIICSEILWNICLLVYQRIY